MLEKTSTYSVFSGAQQGYTKEPQGSPSYNINMTALHKTQSNLEDYGDLDITETRKTALAIQNVTTRQTFTFIVIFVKLYFIFYE
jgi:hypothetical protein